MILNEQILREQVFNQYLKLILESDAKIINKAKKVYGLWRAASTPGEKNAAKKALERLAKRYPYLKKEKFFKSFIKTVSKAAGKVGGVVAKRSAIKTSEKVAQQAAATGAKKLAPHLALTTGKEAAKQLSKWAILKQGSKAALRKMAASAAASLTTGPAAPWISGALLVWTAVDITLLAWALYGTDTPEEAIKALEQDKAKKIKDKYRVIVRGPNGNEEKWFKSQKKRREWMACYEKRGGGDINFDVNASPCGTTTAAPTVKPKVKVKKRRGKSSRCAGKGWGRYKMPADVPYKSFQEFYAALAGNTEALAVLGRKDCRWGPKHDSAYKMLSGAGATAEKPCLPGQKRIEDLQGNSFCWPPKERLAATGDESLESFAGNSPFGKTKLPYRPTTHHPLGPTLEEQKYQKLLDRILKENA